MVSQYMGRQEQKKINTSMSSNLLVMLALAALTVMACFFLPSTVAGIFTTDQKVIATAADYMRILAFIYPLSGMASILAVHMRCYSYAQYPLYISAVGAVVNTVLNYLLIFGNFGFPVMGVKGAAIASLISQMVNLLLMIYFYRKYCQFAFDLGMTSSEVKQYAVMLFPIVANELLWTLGQSVNTFIYGHM